jgi:hypothetical protein
MRVRSLVRTLLPALALALLAQVAAAQAPPLRLALEVNANRSVRGEHEAALSIARQVVTHLTPQLESQGWQVQRVFSARKAARRGKRERYHASVRIDVDAKLVYHLNDARIYEDDRGRDLVTDHSKSAQAWGEYVVWDGMEGEVIEEGEIAPVTPQLQGAGAGRPELDDESSIARLFADSVGKTVLEALKYARATQP